LVELILRADRQDWCRGRGSIVSFFFSFYPRGSKLKKIEAELISRPPPLSFLWQDSSFDELRTRTFSPFDRFSIVVVHPPTVGLKGTSGRKNSPRDLPLSLPSFSLVPVTRPLHPRQLLHPAFNLFVVDPAPLSWKTQMAA